MENCAEIVLIEEITIDHIGKFLRITGNVSFIDISNNLCQIFYKNKYLMIRTNIIDLSKVKIGDQRTFLGNLMTISNDELKSINYISISTLINHPVFVLHASLMLIQQENSLDMVLFEKALSKRRKFLEKKLNSNP
jgi:hypothetical protein